ncbi:MAG: hypothetical protein WDK95_06115 [Syntrophorhabdaceae bacterium]
MRNAKISNIVKEEPNQYGSRRLTCDLTIFGKTKPVIFHWAFDTANGAKYHTFNEPLACRYRTGNRIHNCNITLWLNNDGTYTLESWANRTHARTYPVGWNELVNSKWS